MKNRDLSKCNGKNCPQKESCMRYLLEPSEWQTWSDMDEIRNRKCKFYIKYK